MPNLPYRNLPDLDRADYTEELRRRLYDIAVQIIFYDEPQEPPYTPDQCELTVFRAWGRWLAVWRDWSEELTNDPLPTSRVWQVVRLQNDAAVPHGVMLHEV